jgi:hypothetical protein
MEFLRLEAGDHGQRPAFAPVLSGPANVDEVDAYAAIRTKRAVASQLLERHAGLDDVARVALRGVEAGAWPEPYGPLHLRGPARRPIVRGVLLAAAGADASRPVRAAGRTERILPGLRRSLDGRTVTEIDVELHRVIEPCRASRRLMGAYHIRVRDLGGQIEEAFVIAQQKPRGAGGVLGIVHGPSPRVDGPEGVLQGSVNRRR